MKTYFYLCLVVAVASSSADETFKVVPELSRRTPIFRTTNLAPSVVKAPAAIHTFGREFETNTPIFKPTPTPFIKTTHGDDTFKLVGRKTPIFTPVISTPFISGSKFNPFFKPVHETAGVEKFKLVDSLDQKMPTFQTTFSPIFTPAVVSPINKKFIGEETFELVDNLNRKTVSTPFFKTEHGTAGVEKFQLVDSLEHKMPTFQSKFTPSFTPTFVTPINKGFTGKETFELVENLGHKTFTPMFTPTFTSEQGTIGVEKFELVDSLDRKMPSFQPSFATTFKPKPTMKTECVFPPLPALKKKVTSAPHLNFGEEFGRRTVEPFIFPVRTADFQHTPEFVTPTMFTTPEKTFTFTPLIK